MAKNADKKAHQNMLYWSSIMQVWLAVINVIYLFSILQRIRTDDYMWYYSDVIWLCIYAYVEWKTYGMITDELERGL